MADCPMMKDHATMNKRGDKAMGFSQQKTAHHFHLAKDGGVIEVSAMDPKDQISRTQIRGHLSHVAKMFEQGNFQIPMLVHGKMPDGVSTMQKLKASITYTYQDTKTGGVVRIQSSSPEALAAIHKFLRFQVAEHQTGDPVELSKNS